MAERRFVAREELRDLIRRTFGSSRRLVEVARLAGGSKKGVYRLALDNGSTSILYVWSEAENYWPPSGTDDSDPFADASGAGLFVAAHARLHALGVRTPEVHLVDTSHRDYPADVALTEDVRGGTLERLVEHAPDAAAVALAELGGMLATMHGHRGPAAGRVAAVEAGDAPPGRDATTVVLDRALRHLNAVAGRVAGIGAARDRIEEHARSLAGAVAPRQEYGLIHGELGPDHVLIDDDGRPVLIDIEGLMFFDIEWEHAFTRLRFGPSYERLRAPGLDEARLRFYEFAQSLSLIEGPLRIADGDFPARDLMLDIANWHTGKVLRLVGAARPGAGS
jgi:tRNA A-37 threonylcarbamoyl transferase component Bud32